MFQVTTNINRSTGDLRKLWKLSITTPKNKKVKPNAGVCKLSVGGDFKYFESQIQVDLKRYLPVPYILDYGPPDIAELIPGNVDVDAAFQLPDPDKREILQERYILFRRRMYVISIRLWAWSTLYFAEQSKLTPEHQL